MLVRAEGFRVGSGSTQPRFKVQLMYLLACDLGSVIFLYLDNSLVRVVACEALRAGLDTWKALK